MGQSKGSGYTERSIVTPEVSTFLQQLLQSSGQNQQGAAQGFNQFLPGGGGGKAITEQANKNFQQQTVPSILNAFGTGSKGSSSLNQALAAGASNLNTDLASMLSQMQLTAASGLGGLGQGQAQIGATTPQFALEQKQQPFWQQALLAALGAGGQVGGSLLGSGSLGNSSSLGNVPKKPNTLGVGPAGLYPLQGNFNPYG